MYSLLGGLQESKRHYHGVVYRGMGLGSVASSAYKKGLLFYWSGFTSCTKELKISTKWSRCTAVSVINIPQRFSHACFNIDDISKFPSEKEVLLQPYTCFRVLNNPTQSNDSGKDLTKIELVIEGTACNLSGVWTCDDNELNVKDAGTYCISHYRQKVFWFERQSKARWNFANVCCGTINNDYELTIQWGDLPLKTADDMSGCWEGDDGSCYMIGTCQTQIYWLAIDKNNRWAHVRVGTYNNNIISMNWDDLIIGQNRIHDAIECRIISSNKILIVKCIHGQFLTKELMKKS
ncbi:unnamed protein product [Rotaria sp. Silwood1]|nr:unnamed protein product [Rotaria sp. Silwood1]